MKTDTPKNKSKQEKKDQENKSKPFSNYTQYLKYSGLAIQMAVMVAIGYWLGSLLDKWMHNRYPIFMVLFIFLFLFGSIYSLIKNLPKD